MKRIQWNPGKISRKRICFRILFFLNSGPILPTGLLRVSCGSFGFVPNSPLINSTYRSSSFIIHEVGSFFEILFAVRSTIAMYSVCSLLVQSWTKCSALRLEQRKTILFPTKMLHFSCFCSIFLYQRILHFRRIRRNE